MDIVTPELGGQGWVRNPADQLPLLFAQAIVSDHSQSNIYAGTITSIPHIVAKHQKNPPVMASELEIALTEYMQRVFDTVQVSVSNIETEDSEYTLAIAITVTRNGITHSLNNVASIANGVLANVIQEVNR